MDSIAFYLTKLKLLAPKMNSLSPQLKPKRKYHALADAIYWSDEIPNDLEADEEDSIRILLRYRTSVMLGKEEEEWKRFWDIGPQSFPNWIGFAPSRLLPEPSTIRFYKDKASKLHQDIENADLE